MNYLLKNDVLTLFLAGKIDSSNADSVENELQKICCANEFHKLLLDMESLTYISSAGLRVILRVRKQHPALELINASTEIYEILQMTGFTEMMSVTKAYRHLSVDGCQVIGQGANGKVYRLDPDTVIKVYFNSDALPDIQRERELARKAFILGIPTAIPYDIVRVNDSYGSVFELLNAKSLAKVLKEDLGKLDECAQQAVQLLKTIHGTVLKQGEMPDEKEIALGWVNFLKEYLPEDQYRKLYSLIEAIPQDNHMLHGDYHIKNVMIQNHETLLIDMDTLCLGHPVFEFASIYLAYYGYGETDHRIVSEFFDLPYAICVELMRKIFWYYFDIQDESEYNQIIDKVRVIGYTRMMRRTIRRNRNTPEGKTLIEHCKTQLSDLLSRIDSLII